MKNLSKIPALLLFILLFGGTMGNANPANSISEPGHTGEEASSIYPANNPNLFAIPHQEKTGLNLLDRLPIANSADHSQNNSSGFLLVESFVQREAAIYLRFCKTINCSLGVRKLIFPFHSHW